MSWSIARLPPVPIELAASCPSRLAQAGSQRLMALRLGRLRLAGDAMTKKLTMLHADRLFPASKFIGCSYPMFPNLAATIAVDRLHETIRRIEAAAAALANPRNADHGPKICRALMELIDLAERQNADCGQTIGAGPTPGLSEKFAAFRHMAKQALERRERT